MKNLFILTLLFYACGVVSAQKLEFRPYAQYSFHNIASTQAFGAKLESLVHLNKKSSLVASFDLLYGEGNKNFEQLKPGFYSFVFDKSDIGVQSQLRYLYPRILEIKSARLTQMTFKLGYCHSFPYKKGVFEVVPAAYLNYVSGMYIVDLLEGIPSATLTEPFDYFVVHYFFDYFDIGPSLTARYIFHTKKSKVEPIIGIEYNYGTQRGSWSALSLGLRLK